MNLRCNNFGNTSFKNELVDEVFNINDRILVVKNIKALVCDICGEKYFSPGIQKETLKLIDNQNNVKQNIVADVFEFA